MPPLPTLKGRDVIRILEKNGFTKRGQKGSHTFFENATGTRCTVPIHPGKDVPNGTLHAIIEDSQLPREAFIKKRRGIFRN